MKIRILLLLSLLTMSLQAEERSMVPTKSGMFNVGGFSLYLECYENDKPKLILEQGFGRFGSDGVWLPNIERLKSDFSVCLYDRSGLGKSEAGPVPLTVNDTADRLHALLQTAGVTPPYYFAGGSYASNIITAYNHKYNQEVLGAVFIAPSPFGYFFTMGTRWPEDFEPKDDELARYYQFEQSVKNPMFKRAPEKIDHMQSYEQLKGAQDFGNKPLIVVLSKPSTERYDPPFVPDHIAVKMDTLFDEAETNFKALSNNAVVVYSESEKHHLHIADRDLVVKSIKSLLD